MGKRSALRRTRPLYIFLSLMLIFPPMFVEGHQELRSPEAEKLSKTEIQQLEKALERALLEKARVAFESYIRQDESLAKIANIYLQTRLFKRQCEALRAIKRVGARTTLLSSYLDVVCDSVRDADENVRLAVLRQIVSGYDEYFSLFRIGVPFTAEATRSLLRALQLDGQLPNSLWPQDIISPVDWVPLFGGCKVLVDLSQAGDAYISYWMLLGHQRRNDIDDAKLEELLRKLREVGRMLDIARQESGVRYVYEPKSSFSSSRKERTGRSIKTKTSPRTLPQEPKPAPEASESRINPLSLGVVFGLAEYAYGKSIRVGVRSETECRFPIDAWLSRRIGIDALNTLVFGEIGYGSLGLKRKVVHDWFWSAGLKTNFPEDYGFPFFVRVGLLGYYVSERANTSSASTSRAGALVGAGLTLRKNSRVSVELGVDFVTAKRLANSQMWVQVQMGL